MGVIRAIIRAHAARRLQHHEDRLRTIKARGAYIIANMAKIHHHVARIRHYSKVIHGSR